MFLIWASEVWTPFCWQADAVKEVGKLSEVRIEPDIYPFQLMYQGGLSRGFRTHLRQETGET